MYCKISVKCVHKLCRCYSQCSLLASYFYIAYDHVQKVVHVSCSMALCMSLQNQLMSLMLPFVSAGCHAIFPIHALQGVCFGDEAAATDKDFLASQGFMLVISSQAVAMPEGSSVKQLSNLAGELH